MAEHTHLHHDTGDQERFSRSSRVMPLSIILPAKNEALALPRLLAQLRQHQPQAELIVVDDGSTDATATIAADAGAKVIRHPYPMGNGAARSSE